MTKHQESLRKNLYHSEHDINDLIRLEDSARCTLCAIHQTINSVDNFPCFNHQMLKLCSPRSKSAISSRIKRKTRNMTNTHYEPLNKEYKNHYHHHHHHQHQHHSCDSKIHRNVSFEEQINLIPEHQSINIEKRNSCPGKMCPYVPLSSANFDASQEHTDDVVTELQVEMEKVKKHITHISRDRSLKSQKSLIKQPCRQCTSQIDIINDLKNENTKLKREINTKRKLLEKSKTDSTKIKDIFHDYDKKIVLLQNQIEKCSKTAKLNKQHEQQIKTMQTENDMLLKVIKDKEFEISNMSTNMTRMACAFEETWEKCTFLNESKQGCQESIDLLKVQLINSTAQLDEYKSTILSLRKKVYGLKETCKKTINKIKEQKNTQQNQLQEKIDLLKQISDLTLKLQNSTDEISSQKTALDQLECQCKKYEEQLVQFDEFSKKCQELEKTSKHHYDSLIHAEEIFKKDRNDMQQLINELENTIDDNRSTINEMTRINNEQELLIKSQSVDLLTKNEQLELLEKQSVHFKCLNQHLEQQMLKLNSGPCSREDCICISRTLMETKTALNIEKDSQIIKEQIIQDQSVTILDLQNQMETKVMELNKAVCDTKYLEEEIEKINEKLIEKHTELDKEIDENENLHEKLKILEKQKNNLNTERKYFESLLQNIQQENQFKKHLENIIPGDETSVKIAMEKMAKDKQKAITAAQFISQTLLDTVSNFQKQADARKKVQILLTKMLWTKDEQLRDVINKISTINNISKEVSLPDTPLNELFFTDLISNFNSDTTTTSTIYSSCSSCNKKCNTTSCNQPQGDITNENII